MSVQEADGADETGRKELVVLLPQTPRGERMAAGGRGLAFPDPAWDCDDSALVPLGLPRAVFGVAGEGVVADQTVRPEVGDFDFEGEGGGGGRAGARPSRVYGRAGARPSRGFGDVHAVGGLPQDGEGLAVDGDGGDVLHVAEVEDEAVRGRGAWVGNGFLVDG